jgi:hypothetical protein
VQLSGLSTDPTGSIGWHIGNAATALTPLGSVLYVDDVEVSTAFVP